jgi:hypothetical protein
MRILSMDNRVMPDTRNRRGILRGVVAYEAETAICSMPTSDVPCAAIIEDEQLLYG